MITEYYGNDSYVVAAGEDEGGGGAITGRLCIFQKSFS